MKYILLLLLFLPLLAHSAARKNHYIALNIYIIEDGQKYPLYETQKMYKKFYDLLTSDDEIFADYKNKFYDLKYIEVFIPNKVGEIQSLIIGFRNKTEIHRTYVKGNFFMFTMFYTVNDNKFFSYEFLKNNRENLAEIQSEDDYRSVVYAPILKVSY